MIHTLSRLRRNLRRRLSRHSFQKSARRAARRPVSKIDALISALTVGLLVLCAGMAGIGFVAPSAPLKEKPPSSAAPDKASPYSSLTASSPMYLRVPALKIKAPVVPIQVADRVLEPPSDPLEVGWWDLSARPGEHSGQTVITGHTVHTGGGAMDRLPELHKGQKVDVETYLGTMRYKVDRTGVLSKDEVATAAQDLFGQDRGDGRLILITCTDWNGSFYESNSIALALPLGEPVDAT